MRVTLDILANFRHPVAVDMTPMRCKAFEDIRESMEEMLKENQRLREEIEREVEISDLRGNETDIKHVAVGS